MTSLSTTHSLSRGTRRILALALAASLAGCGTTVGNGLTEPVGLGFKAYSTTALAAPARFAGGEVSSLTLCLKRIRFKAAPGDGSGQNVTLKLGEVTLSPTGTTIENVTVPAGTYRRIEIDLHDKCASGTSVKLVGTGGSFSTAQAITIRFEGTTTITGDVQSVLLDIQAIVSALAATSSEADIKTLAEGAAGTY